MRHLHDNLSLIGAAARIFFCWSLVSGVLLGWSRVMRPKIAFRFGYCHNLSKIVRSRILERI